MNDENTWLRYELFVTSTLRSHSDKLDTLASELSEIKMLLEVSRNELRLKTGFVGGVVSLVVSVLVAAAGFIVQAASHPR